MTPTPPPNKPQRTAKGPSDEFTGSTSKCEAEKKQRDSAAADARTLSPNSGVNQEDQVADARARHMIFPVPSPPDNLLSAIDLALLQAVSRHPKASTGVLAEEVGIKANEVRERIARLFSDGSLLGIRAIVKPFDVPLDSVKMFCHIRLSSHLASARNKFTAMVNDRPAVIRCFEVSADFDYLLQIVVPDMPSVRALISELPHIEHIKVLSVINESI